MSLESFDLIVIGGGPGGHAVAEEAARHGARVAIIERNGWGGTCTHRGCIPTKALLACSGHYAALKKLSRMGVATGAAAYDFAAIRRHRDQTVRIAALGVEKSLEGAGVETKTGEGRIAAPGEVICTAPNGETESLRARRIVIAWGSEPATIFPPSARILTSDTFLRLAALPKSIVIIGGSVIGVEFATFLAELGIPVRIVEILPSILPYEEEEAGTFLQKELTRLGVEVHTATQVEELREDGDGIRAVAVKDGQAMEFQAEYALLCTGRRPRLDAATLAGTGIRHDRRGIAVNDGQETSIPGIFAVGDVTGGIMLAHRAMQQGRALGSRLFGDGAVGCREDAVPSVTYTHPPVARVGLTEAQARERGWDVEILRNDYGANIMARTELAGQGFAKFIFNEERLVGATIAGAGAPDLIAALTLAVAAGMERRTLQSWILPHPTLSEILRL